MKTMKTCKMGCGKMKAGGPVKKVKKMAAGGQAYMTKTIPGYNVTTNPMVMKGGGSTKSKFGLLSVIAGIDNNPKPTAADRIAGAKKRAGKKK